jgi:hypothetical protein
MPTIDEGFESIVKINFIPDFFDSKEDEDAYNLISMP